ncbi:MULTISPECIES: ABC transporter substrate-binding protein [Cytobacillus]|jgi:spermidine/putrescine transport system substrate-binding protein|uniref:Spermidine/putrescine ABC transporter substrate-binding protein n=2 Tax=Cytobacillus oceanisediminis TaxID=665099 RepID=A0A160MBU9_9BACI|nr:MULTISPECIES: ABC transporter substrate-binding protein [Cytobacillus]EFV76064.1 spermidine/putrescine ABC transporter [Bacillus sp. 2_A_57_CT2]MBY0156192.1 ABC transporter substrate-binding protein [Cytobacillus firmus]AND40063.1 spermidine/putrescine ABC transporter substrate-binding protein [Cytobacillus oceanisediminis 2691]MCM3392558.1 ABC transporter substrate-binding protein [Cytobacillus oceanisediminis]MCS0826086.1 ABC transporter substrate-binding protein [Cytobacillus firmus]
MKKLVQALAAVLIVSFALLYIASGLNSSQGYTSGNTLTIFNWGDYIDADLVDKFEQETGIKVIYETFDSNEAMMTKIEQGGTAYDIAVPSEYAIEKMKEEDLLLPVDHSKIPNLKYIDQRFMDLPFDPGNEYSIPYFWGTVGILYNTDILGDKKITSWNDLWDPELKNQILLIDGAREVMGMGLNSLHYSLNDKNRDHLVEAKQKLDSLTPNIKAIVGDEIRMLMENDEAGIGVVWSGTAQELMWEKDNLEYVLPEEGSNLWFDNMVIPKTAKNPEAAHQFMNFILDPENAAQNTEYVGYSTPNKEALKYMDEETISDERFYPDEEMTARLEVYENLGKRMLAYYNELFLEFKMHKK